MSAIEVIDFKKKYVKFLETLDYVNKKWDEIENDPAKIKKYILNFLTKYSNPVDEAWKLLSDTERTTFLNSFKGGI